MNILLFIINIKRYLYKNKNKNPQKKFLWIKNIYIYNKIVINLY